LNNYKYAYHCKGDWNSGKMHLRFISVTNDEYFMSDLLSAIHSINPVAQLSKPELHAYNDEVTFLVKSDLGDFYIYIESLETVSVHAPANKSCILKLNELLTMDSRFKQKS
jgi:hypothetical protein